MSITGKFTADFSDFNMAVQQTAIKLRSFEADSAKVGTALNRMADSFSGRKIIQDATLMATAGQDRGGPSKLPADQMRRLGTTTNEALAIMKARAIPIPPILRQIADETKTATKATDAFGSTIKQLALSFGALFTLRAAGQFI